MVVTSQLPLPLRSVDEELPVNPEGDYGEVFTRRWVVDLILDLAGYTSDKDLAAQVAVEPACGAGAFLVPMVERLMESCQLRGRSVEDAAGAIRAFDLLSSNVELARKTVVAALATCCTEDEARELARGWVGEGDFLLVQHDGLEADYVLGNPPYLRLEDVPPARGAAYRRRCPTMRGRSDIFVGFIETGLHLLRPDGVLAFIVADRWMHNQYGADLRALVTSSFSVDAHIEMHDVDAFDEPVSAYPAITLIRRAEQGPALTAKTTNLFGEEAASQLLTWRRRGSLRPLALPAVTAAALPAWFEGTEQWPSGSPEQLALISDLEKRFPPLEDPTTGTRIGIGLATGADDIYLTKEPELCEPERLLPMVRARDISSGSVEWSGTYLVNPWRDDGLVALDEWPRMRAHFEEHATRVKSRHTARKHPDRWYRTIDRVDPKLASTPKLLLPDMKASSHPVLEEGRYYPHHNLYFVTSTSWDLEVLGGLLLSDITNLLVGSYCVKMRGGCYRFQAQYLRRVRVPGIDALTKSDREALARAFCQRDLDAATAVAYRLYGIDCRDLVTSRRV
jgi:hypothetical protein